MTMEECARTPGTAAVRALTPVRYGLAILLPFGVLLIRLVLLHLVDVRPYFGLFYLVVALAAFALGTGPAIATAVSSMVVVAAFVVDGARYTSPWYGANALGLCLFGAVSGVIIFFSESRARTTGKLRAALRSAETARSEADRRRAEAEAAVRDAEQRRLDAERKERQLADVARDLAASNRDLEHFAAIAAHDLKQPLSNICMSVNLLRMAHEEELSPEMAEVVQDLRDQCDRLARMVDGILRLARASSKPLNREVIPLDEPLREAVTALRPAIDEAGAEIEWGELPTVSADPVLVSQVFQNLIGNAVKFCYPADCPPRADCRIRVNASRDNGDWRIAVKDNGVGFDAAKSAEIFETFGRAHKTEGYDGTGLGLSICKRIIERHGGRIWAESLPGKGTTFYFTLPASGIGRTKEVTVASR